MIVYASEASQAAQAVVHKINVAIIFPLMTLMTAVAILLFLWGGFQFVFNAADENARTTGRRHMIWGIFGLLVLLSAYTILRIAAGTFDVPIPGSE